MNTMFKAVGSKKPQKFNKSVQHFRVFMNDNPRAPLSVEDLDRLSEAYNGLMDEKRRQFLELETSDSESPLPDDEEISATDFSAKYETRAELMDICTEGIDIVNNNLLQNVEGCHQTALIHKFMGDCYRWLMERDELSREHAIKAYNEAMTIYQWNFESTEPCLLKLVKVFSTFLNDVGQSDKAEMVLKTALECAARDVRNSQTAEKPPAMIQLALADLTNDLDTYRANFNKRISEYVATLGGGGGSSYGR